MVSIRTAMIYTLLSSNMAVAFQFIGSLVIARLLTPTEFGIYSIAAVVVGLAQLVADFGASGYIVQSENLSRDTLRSAFGLVLTTAWTLAAMLWLSSGFVADYYREPAISGVLNILAFNLVIAPIGSVTFSVARRNMRFRSIAAIEVSSGALQLVVSIALASYGFGAASLAWSAVGATAVMAAGSMLIRTSDAPWLPSFRNMGPIAYFGLSMIGAGFLGHLANNAPDVVIGRMLDLHAVGLFNRAASLNRMFGTMLQRVVGPVLLPALSRLRRDGADLGKALSSGTRAITSVTWPVYLTIAALAEPLTITLFGTQWKESVPLVPYICITAALSSTYSMCGSLHVARGKPQLCLKLEAFGLIVKFAAVVAFASGGILAIARAWPAIGLICAAFHHFILKKHYGLRPAQLLRPLAFNLVVGLACSLAAVLPDYFLRINGVGGVVRIAAGSTAALAIWLAFLLLPLHPLRTEVATALAALRQHLRSRSKSA